MGAISGELQFSYYVEKWYRSGISSLNVLNEIQKVVHCGLTFAPFSPFFDEFDDLIGRMVSGGFFNFWKSSSLLKLKAEDIGPQVLTMDHMEVAFLASLLPFTLAIFCFVAEVSVHWTNIFVPRVRAFFVIKAFYELFKRH